MTPGKPSVRPTKREKPQERRSRLKRTGGQFPATPGVYLFRDVTGTVAYVGKAVNLRKRVLSYFRGKRPDGRRATRFVDRYVHAMEFITTETEQEALLLENKLIKQHKPDYNVRLRDDKDFLYVRVDRSHDFPALVLARRPKRGRGGKVTYHGPFANAGGLRRTLRVIGGIIPLRDCSDREFSLRTRPCLKHDMGRCCAPCVDRVDSSTYGDYVADAVNVLEGDAESLVASLEERMLEASRDEAYELAARHRDQIAYLRSVTSRQQIENVGIEEADVLGLHRAGDLAEIVVLFFRRGALVSRASHTLESALSEEDLLAGFLEAFYAGARPIPREILLPGKVADPSLTKQALASRREGAVSLAVPRGGVRRRLVLLAQRNARHSLAMAVEQRGQQHQMLSALKERLNLPRIPLTIECYDVSNTGRDSAVASRVVFHHGEADRRRYRIYRLRSFAGQNDYAAMEEVLRRRMRRRKTDPLPDLLLVDGGRAHLAVAERVCEEFGVGDLALAGLAKGGRRGRSLLLHAGEQERIFLPGREDPVTMNRNSAEEYVLQHIRDEAHRFAIGHHRKLRSRTSMSSALDGIPGVGPVIKKRLLQGFGGLRGLRDATGAELAQTRGVSPRLAEEIVLYLQERR